MSPTYSLLPFGTLWLLGAGRGQAPLKSSFSGVLSEGRSEGFSWGAGGGRGLQVARRVLSVTNL